MLFYASSQRTLVGGDADAAWPVAQLWHKQATLRAAAGILSSVSREI